MRELQVQGARHPLADSIGAAGAGGSDDAVIVTESRAPVIFLTAARVSLLSLARDAHRRVILVTDEHSALTEPLAEVWRDAGAAWVVREADGGLREGFTGRILTDVANVFSTPPATSVDEVSLRFLRPGTATAVQLITSVSTRHRARETTSLGQTLEALASATARSVPTSWGPHEPLGTAWNRTAFTRFARERMPADTLLVANGVGFTSTLTVRRTSQGVEEITRLVASTVAPSTVEFGRRVAESSVALGELARTGMPLVGLVLARTGRDDLLVPPVLQAPPSPLTLMIGAPGVKALELDPRRMVAEFGAVIVGKPRIPGLVFPLGSLGDPTWSRLDSILGAVDRALLSEVLGVTGRLLTSQRPDTAGSTSGRPDDGGAGHVE